MTERAFVLMPLLELLPEAADPRDGRKYAAYLSGCGQ
jgi:7,8-dihydro-6-hydroxymethylpterin-pyrophosphokinase